MTAAERLNELVKYMHTNIKSLSELCGYERPQAFYDIQKGKTKNISPTMCDRILAVFPNVNRVWMLTGEGEMIAGKSAEKQDAENNQNGHMVPFVHISALAGPLESYYEKGEDLSQSEKIWCPSPQGELAVPISGDSMEPVFQDGSIAFIKKINEVAFIPWGHPMVIETENGIFIKNVLPDNDDALYVWAESVNPKYPPMHIPKTSIFGMYRVISVSKNFFAM